jgi:hypothetical protein
MLLICKFSKESPGFLTHSSSLTGKKNSEMITMEKIYELYKEWCVQGRFYPSLFCLFICFVSLLCVTSMTVFFYINKGTAEQTEDAIEEGTVMSRADSSQSEKTVVGVYII